MLVGGVLFGALELWPSWPRETEIEFALGAEHADVVELHITYLKDADELHGVRFDFPSGAPSIVRHSVTLPEGAFLLRCHLRQRSGPAREVTRELATPVEGRVRISLSDRSPTTARDAA